MISPCLMKSKRVWPADGLTYMPYDVVIAVLLRLTFALLVFHSESQGSPGTVTAALRCSLPWLFFVCKSGFSCTIVASRQMGSWWSSGVSPLILGAVPPLSLGVAAHLLWLTGLPVLSSPGNFASVGRALFDNVFRSSQAHLPVSLCLLWVSPSSLVSLFFFPLTLSLFICKVFVGWIHLAWLFHGLLFKEVVKPFKWHLLSPGCFSSAWKHLPSMTGGNN